MATFSNIGIDEPGTIDKRAASVRIDRGGTLEEQEIVVLGDSDSSLAIGRVVAAAPDSTHFGLVVRQVGYVAPTTGTFSISSIAGRTFVDQNSTVWVTQVSSVAGFVNVLSTQSLNSSAYLPVRLTDGSSFLAGGVEYTDASTTSTLAAPGLAFHNSSNYTMRLAGSSTPFPIHVRTSSGADMGDSTNNALRVNVVAGSAAGSTEATVRQSTYTDFNALSRLADRDQSTQIAAVLNATPASTVWALAVRDVVPNSTTVNVSSLAGAVIVRSSAADHLGTVYQSTFTDFNTLSRLADRDQSTQVAAVLNAAPASTVWALAVREVAQSTGTFAISSIAGRTLVDQNSTVWPVQVSSVAGAVIVRSSAADSLHTVYQSTFTDLNCRVNAPSTANSSNYLPVRLTNSTAFLEGVLEYTDGSTISTLAAAGVTYSNSSNNTMRLVGVTQPFPVQMRTGTLSYLSTCFSTMGNNSTSSTVVSSAASVRHKVFAYSITSTVQAVNTLSFASSLANPIWQVQMQSISSGISGANLAVTPPAFLFATEAASPLVFKITGSTGSYHLSFSYFSEA